MVQTQGTAGLAPKFERAPHACTSERNLSRWGSICQAILANRGVENVENGLEASFLGGSQ